MDEAKARLLKNIEKVKKKTGITPELENKICNLYIFEKLSDDEFIDILGDEEAQGNEEE